MEPFFLKTILDILNFRTSNVADSNYLNFYWNNAFCASCGPHIRQDKKKSDNTRSELLQFFIALS
jgi:hypothetical protein